MSVAGGRARELAGSLAFAALALAAGCGGGGSNGRETLTVYVSAPLHGERAEEGRAIVDGAKLALQGHGGRVGDLRVRAVYLDDTGGAARWSPAVSAANARRAAEDSSAIGYLGELDSGATRFSLPITNQAEIVQISPGSTAVDLTREEAGGVDPDQYRPSGEQTFARVVPDDGVQARAAARLAKQLGAQRVLVLAERSRFGGTLAAAFARAAGGLGVEVQMSGLSGDLTVARVPPGPSFDATYFAGASERGLARSGIDDPQTPLIASDALYEASLRHCGDLPPRLYVTSPFREPFELLPDAKPFIGAYRARFGQPAAAAAYGYEAMALLLDAIQRAGDRGDDRGAVIDEVLSTRDRRSILGPYSIDGHGDTTLDLISVYAIHDCRRSFDRQLRAPP